MREEGELGVSAVKVVRLAGSELGWTSARDMLSVMRLLSSLRDVCSRLFGRCSIFLLHHNFTSSSRVLVLGPVTSMRSGKQAARIISREELHLFKPDARNDWRTG